MEDPLARLVRAQRHEERLVILARRAEALPAELSGRAAQLRALEAEADQAEAERKSALVRAQELESDVRQRETRVAKLEKQALEARDPSSVRVAQHEAGELRTQNATAQDQALALLEKAEELERRRGELRARLTTVREDHEQFAANVAADLAALKAEIAALAGRRDEALAGLDAEIRDHFRALGRRNPGRVVAALKGDSCGGCGTRLTPNDAVKVRAKAAPARCPSCARFLVPPEVWQAAEAV